MGLHARGTHQSQATGSLRQQCSPPSAWRAFRRLLVVRLDNIGDVVMLGPALRCLKHALPQASITLLASPAGAQAAPLLPWVDEVVVHSAVWQELGHEAMPDPGQLNALVKTLRSARFDAALIFTSFSQSPHPPAYACYLAGIPVRVGQSKEFGGALLTQWVKPQPDGTHQVDRNLFLLQAAGFRAEERALALHVPAPAQASADRLLERAGVDLRQSFIVLAPGASCAARRYELSRMKAVARALPRAAGLPVVVVGSEREREQLAPLLTPATAGDRVSLVGQTTIPELAGVLQRAALVVANNSGPMHMADALRRPLVVLYSGTELESQWRPRSTAATLLNRPVSCSPCYNFTCPYDLECLDVPPREVLAEALRLLGGQALPDVKREYTQAPVEKGSWL